MILEFLFLYDFLHKNRIESLVCQQIMIKAHLQKLGQNKYFHS